MTSEIRTYSPTTTRAREALFAGCRDGRIAVLIGSTAKVGIGVNVQDRLHSIHRVDPPWTPAAWEPRCHPIIQPDHDLCSGAAPYGWLESHSNE